MNWSLKPLCFPYGDGGAKPEFYMQFWTFHAIPKKKHFYIDPHCTLIGIGDWFTQFLAKMLVLNCLLSCPPVLYEGFQK